MRSRPWFPLFLVIVQAACLAGCKSSTAPGSSAVADFVTGVTASDGTAASRQSSTPPAANGGPTVTVTSSGSVRSGGSDFAILQSSASFRTVYVSIGGANGFYQLQLAAPTTTITLTDTLSGQLPVNSYVTLYQAASPAGLIGAAASVTNTVNTATLQLTGVWNIGATWTSETGKCVGEDPLNQFESAGQTTVSSSGSFTVTTPDGISFPGTMNLSTGVWSLSGTGPGCGTDPTQTFSASGVCSSSTACSGTVSVTSSPGPGTESGTVTWSR